jgi:hypothetical protein
LWERKVERDGKELSPREDRVFAQDIRQVFEGFFRIRERE